jgi:hypothetical protein
MKESYKNVKNISFPKLQEYKEGWAKFIPERAYRGKPIAGALREVQDTAAGLAREKIYNAFDDTLRQAYIDYGNLKSIAEAGIKSIDPLRSKGAFKQAWEALIDVGITPISSILGKVIYKTGGGLEFVGEKGMKKIGDLIK